LYWDSRQCYKVFDNLDIFILHSRFFFQSRNENAISKLALTQHSIVDLWGEKNGYFYMLISSKKKWSNNIGKKKFGWSSHGACHCWKWNTSNKLLNELTQIESREGKERKKKTSNTHWTFNDNRIYNKINPMQLRKVASYNWSGSYMATFY
jgi:hypothetical protein